MTRRPRVPAHRLLLGFSLGMLVLLLLIDGFTTKTVGAAGTGSGPDSHSPLTGSRPILSAAGKGLHSAEPPFGRRVALTFDDGPDPRWTPKIARILLAAHAPATFFEVGSMVVRHPDLTAMLYHDGFELGDHTFTHADLTTLSGWQRTLQVGATDSAIAGVTGIRTRLVRPPYSSTPDAVTPAEESAWNAVAEQGYDIVLSDYDTEDWSQPGVGQILRNAMPRGRNGGIILMHDAGGRRQETVDALPRLIAQLRNRGFKLVRVSDLAGVPVSAVEVPAGAWQRERGALFVAMLGIAGFVTTWLTRLVFLVTGLVAARMVFTVITARIQVRRTRTLPTDLSYHPAASILVPAFNEAAGIERSVRSLAASHYPAALEVIVVDDGSSDGTAGLVAALEEPRVRLLRQPNAGKAAALNRALQASRHEIVVTVDADTVFEPDTLITLVQRFREPHVGAVSGNTKVANRRGLLGRWQHIEYVMGFNLDRRMYEVLGCTPCVPGAIGAFRRGALADVGGVSGATLAEDTDVTLDIGRAGWHVVYEPRARAWTEAPSTLRALFRQRTRWAYGTIQSVWKHRNALWRDRDGRIGRRALPYLLLFQVLLPLAAPLIDLFAIYSLLFLDSMPILGFWLAFNAFQFTLAWCAFGWDHEPRGVLWALPAQQLAYRQIGYLVVIEALLRAVMGTRAQWNRVERTGELEAGAA